MEPLWAQVGPRRRPERAGRRQNAGKRRTKNILKKRPILGGLLGEVGGMSGRIWLVHGGWGFGHSEAEKCGFRMGGVAIFVFSGAFGIPGPSNSIEDAVFPACIGDAGLADVSQAKKVRPLFSTPRVPLDEVRWILSPNG